MHIVIGLGKTGLACVRYLRQQGLQVGVVDTRENPPGLVELQQHFSEVPVKLGGLYGEWLQQATQLVVSPGIAISEPEIMAAMKQGVTVVGDIELFAKVAKAPILAVTGSNGKTTVVTLLGLMLEAAGYRVEVCGNIGTPVLDVLNNPVPDFYVLELSSFQLETTYSLQTAAATILNVTEDHMDRYTNFSEYLKAKQRIYDHAAAAIVNIEDPSVWQDLKLPRRCYSFGLREADFHVLEETGVASICYENKKLLPLQEMKLHGKHHALNALAALAMGHAVGASLEKMVDVLRNFAGLPHRCQWVAKRNGVVWFNDSKGTNVGASIVALDTVGTMIPGKLILIAGGLTKDADLHPLRDSIRQHVSHVILIGRDAYLFQELLKGVVPLTLADSMKDAVASAAKVAESGDGVLLSPACASFDMFDNYEHRGHCFVEELNKL